MHSDDKTQWRTCRKQIGGMHYHRRRDLLIVKNTAIHYSLLNAYVGVKQQLQIKYQPILYRTMFDKLLLTTRGEFMTKNARKAFGKA